MSKPTCCKGCVIEHRDWDKNISDVAEIGCEHFAREEDGCHHKIQIGLGREVWLCERCWKAVVADVLSEYIRIPQPLLMAPDYYWTAGRTY